VQKVAVIGLGRFGLTLARRLGQAGVQVIAIDRNPHLVDDVKDDVSHAVRLDSTDEHALISQGVHNVDVAVVAIGENFEASLLTATIVKKLGVPFVICRALTATHAAIFKRLGADEVIQPEMQAGEDLARRLANPHLQDMIVLDDGFSLVELPAPAAFQNKTLEQLQLRQRYQVNLVGLKRVKQAGGGRGGLYIPAPGEVILGSDIMVLIGSDDAVAQLPRE
jgi:trk system potassium uptake protein TrkA